MLAELLRYLEYPFVRYAIVAAMLISLCSALVGVILVLKRYSYIGDGLSHVAFGAMSPQLAERTGFSDDDAEKIKAVLTKLFEGDASSARPEGSMQVLKLIWWEHNSKSGQYSSAKVHGSLKVNADGSYELEKLDGLTPQEIDGF